MSDTIGSVPAGEAEQAAWLPFEAEDGYPTEEWLERFAKRAYCPGEAARFLVNELPEIEKQVSCMFVEVTGLPDTGQREMGKLVYFATGGWSGAEDLINAMLGHLWIKHLHSKWERGGAYWFEVSDDLLQRPADPRLGRVPHAFSPSSGGEEELRKRIVDLEAGMDAAWRKVISYPFGQVCKHYVASHMLSDMETLGFAVTPEVAHAVVFAEDEAALAHPPIRARLNPEGSRT